MLDFTPKRIMLFDGVDEYPQDVWVCIVPPTWRVDKERNSRAQLCRDMQAPGMQLVAHELWLTFGGSNLEVEIPEIDELGRTQWTEKEDGTFVVKTEKVVFSERPDMSEEDFMQKLDLLPSEIVNFWYVAMLEVVPHWGATFRSQEVP